MTKDKFQKAVDDAITACIRNDYSFGSYARKVTAAVWPVLEAAEKERDALRAKIEQMERQEPVAWLHETRRDSDVVTDAVKHVWGRVAVGSMAAYSIPLYTLSGAKGE